MMYLMAPAQQIQTTIVLPSPLPENREGHVISVSPRRAMNNTLYTYTKNQGRIRLTYKFSLFRGKALELQAFIDAYIMSDIRIIDYKNHTYIVNLMGDPFEFATVAREEITEITLTFEGIKVG